MDVPSSPWVLHPRFSPCTRPWTAAPAGLLGLGSDPNVIITVTLNPSLDLTYTLREVGRDIDVHRASRSTLEASGKGVNVSRTLNKVAVPTVAVLPVGGVIGAP